MNHPRLIALLLLAVFTGAPAHAAEVSLQTPLAAAQSPFLIPVTFTPDAESVNTVEGSISVPDGVIIDSIDTSGSAFSIFASGPVYVLSSRSIEFTAGAPGGIKKDRVALLFVIKGHADAKGDYAFVTKGVAAYRNDGNGTRVPVASESATLQVGEKGSASVDAFPPSTPTPLVAEIGKDDSLFGGRLFATFYGGASGSSVDHYEIREGWWRASVRADRYYVLQDRNQDSTIWVTAVSTNGKTVTTTIPAAHPWTERFVAAALILVAGTTVFVVWRRFFRRT